MAGVALSLIAMERREGDFDLAEATSLALEFFVGEFDFFFVEAELTAFFDGKDFLVVLASLVFFISVYIAAADAFFF